VCLVSLECPSRVSLLRFVAVCCSVLQFVAACCSVLQRVAVCCSPLRLGAVCCSVLQCVALSLECPSRVSLFRLESLSRVSFSSLSLESLYIMSPSHVSLE